MFFENSNVLALQNGQNQLHISSGSTCIAIYHTVKVPVCDH